MGVILAQALVIVALIVLVIITVVACFKSYKGAEEETIIVGGGLLGLWLFLLCVVVRSFIENIARWSG